MQNERRWGKEMNLIAGIRQREKSKIIGRVGGNVPYVFMDRKKEIEEYRFYMIFQNPDNPKEYISIFIPCDYNFMIDRNIYPNCSVKVFTHPFSKESVDTEYTLENIEKAVIVGYDEADKDQFDFITKSEKPKLIQDEAYFIEKLRQDGYQFFIQIDEDYYFDGLLKTNYVFGYGALYLYRHCERGNVIAGFWQYS